MHEYCPQERRVRWTRVHWWRPLPPGPKVRGLGAPSHHHKLCFLPRRTFAEATSAPLQSNDPGLSESRTEPKYVYNLPNSILDTRVIRVFEFVCEFNAAVMPPHLPDRRVQVPVPVPERRVPGRAPARPALPCRRPAHRHRHRRPLPEPEPEPTSQSLQAREEREYKPSMSRLFCLLLHVTCYTEREKQQGLQKERNDKVLSP